MTVRFSTRAPNSDYLGFQASPEAIVSAAKIHQRKCASQPLTTPLTRAVWTPTRTRA